MGNRKPVWMTCGVCDRSWNDADVSSRTPVPAGRCPFEDIHDDERMMFDGRPVKAVSIRVTVDMLSYVFADYPDGEIPVAGTDDRTTPLRARIAAEIADAVENRSHHLTDSEDGDALVVPAGPVQIAALTVHDIYDGTGYLPEYADVTKLAEGYAGETF